MEAISVKDLPEPIAQAVEAMVNTLRAQLETDKKKRPITLPVWKGKPTGKLARDEIYDDVP